MRILHLIATGQRRGAEVFASDLIAALAAPDLRPAGGGARTATRRGPVGFGVPWPPALGGRPGPAPPRGAVAALRRRLRDWRPDVVQAHGGQAAEVRRPGRPAPGGAAGRATGGSGRCRGCPAGPRRVAVRAAGAPRRPGWWRSPGRCTDRDGGGLRAGPGGAGGDHPQRGRPAPGWLPDRGREATRAALGIAPRRIGRGGVAGRAVLGEGPARAPGGHGPASAPAAAGGCPAVRRRQGRSGPSWRRPPTGRAWPGGCWSSAAAATSATCSRPAT